MVELTRKCSESITLLLAGHPPVVVKICDVDDRRRVRLAFDAPESVKIVRSELLRESANRGSG